jgi:hypothetical protein
MRSKLLSRREALLGVGAIGTWCASATSASALTRTVALPRALSLPRALHPGIHTPPSPKLIGALVDTQDDLRLLEEIAHASFTFFWEQMHPDTGIVRDRRLRRE